MKNAASVLLYYISFYGLLEELAFSRNKVKSIELGDTALEIRFVECCPKDPKAPLTFFVLEQVTLIT